MIIIIIIIITIYKRLFERRNIMSMKYLSVKQSFNVFLL